MNGNCSCAFLGAPDGSLWVIGGYSCETLTGNQIGVNSVWQYVISEDKWKPQPPLDKDLSFLTGVIYPRGSRYMIYLFGGLEFEEDFPTNEVRVLNYNVEGAQFSQGKWEIITYEGEFSYSMVIGAVPVMDKGSAQWPLELYP